ncbi:hypothetical protein NDU88_006448, partial [Pleurodeles waltl]
TITTQILQKKKEEGRGNKQNCKSQFQRNTLVQLFFKYVIQLLHLSPTVLFQVFSAPLIRCLSLASNIHLSRKSLSTWGAGRQNFSQHFAPKRLPCNTTKLCIAMPKRLSLLFVVLTHYVVW